VVEIFIPSSIRDKATRDVLYALSKKIGNSSSSISVQATDPNAGDTGYVGNIIYSSDTDSIWIFTGTIWEKARVSKTITIGIDSTTPGSEGTDPSGWLISSSNFRNNAGVTKALVATLYIDNTANTLAEHNTYTYLWRKNGIANFSSSTTQRSDTGYSSRTIIIDATDIADQGDDAFTCEITYL